MPAATGHVPAVVLDVELTEALPAIPGVGADGRRVAEAWLLVRRHTQPIGMPRLPVPATGLTPADVAAALGDLVQPGGARSSYLDGRTRALASAPELTVVVCTRDRPESLRRTLDSVLGQHYPALRVLVVDNAPTTGATRAVAEAAGVDYLEVPEPGLSRARNAAVRATAGQTVAWLDDDEVADPYYLGEIARGLVEHPDADVLCGSIVPAELETMPQVWFEQFGGLVKGRGFRPVTFSPATRRAHHPLFPLPPFGAGANMVTRPGVIERVGGFDPALGAGSPAMGGEDTLFFSLLLRAGGTIAYQPSILTRHYHRRGLDGLRAQLIGYGTGLTAAYTALVRREPVALFALAGLTPRALGEVLGHSGHRGATLEPDFPRSLLAANRRAMLKGPAAYLGAGAKPHESAADPVDVGVVSTGGGGSRISEGGQEKEAAGAPVKVVLVEVGGELVDISREREGGDYRAARVFALRAGRPVGEVTLPFAGPVIAGREVAAALSKVIKLPAVSGATGEKTAAGGDVANACDEALFVSVIVASSFERRERLERCVAALGELDYPSYEVIVVDNRPVPDVGCWSVLTAHPKTQVVFETRPGTSAARNRGLAAASGEIVAFTDDDTVVDRGWLRAIANRFRAEPDADCVTGLVLPGELETPAQVRFEASGNAFAQKYVRASYAGARFTVANRCAPDPYRRSSVYRLGEYGTGANMAFRTNVLRRLGGFDEALGPGTPAMAGEDILLFLRLLSSGGRLAYEPGAFVRHWHRREFDALLRQTRAYGIGLTAMLTAAVRDDPAQIWGLARTILPGITLLLRGEGGNASTAANAGRATNGARVEDSSTPGSMVAVKRRGMLIGPVAYLRGRRRMRAWR